MLHTILHVPSAYEPSAKHFLIFFIAGNPGLIAYYSTFLGALNRLLSPVSSSNDSWSPLFHVFGRSLPGFEDDDDLSIPATFRRSTPFGLQEQIDLTLELLVGQKISSGSKRGEPFDGIILVGHSVGAYILLELLRKVRQQSMPEGLNVKAGILLFPTVTHIAQSPSGVKLCALLKIPELPRHFSSLVRLLFWPLPRTSLKWVVAIATRMPDDALGASTHLLVSKMALWQALHMARDEMNMITEDKWDEGIWGAENPDLNSREATPRLLFYFGQKDHWVAEHTRDSLIATRGDIEGQSNRPRMLIDQDGIPHEFCINHGEIVAKKVKVWIDEIMMAE